MISNIQSEPLTVSSVGIVPPMWYCARTKPKQEHIAAANVRKTLGLEAFIPRIQFQRNTLRGVVRVVEPLFPSYIINHTVLGAKLDEIRYTSGISGLVHFGQVIPIVPDSTIAELRQYFETDEPVLLEDQIRPGSEICVGSGAFAHLAGIVL